MELVAEKILSPAKINLMLRILGQRPDGYHEIQTSFQLLEWGDLMCFEPIRENGQNQIEITGFENLSKKNNIIYKAAKMILPWAENRSDWHIHVDKNIPQGAGLGGGSSNAATTLKFLNRAWQCDLSTFDLLALAVKLGADVPVFIYGQGALAGGIGDVLLPQKFATPNILLLLPDCHVSTAEVFNESALQRDQMELKLNQLHEESFWINGFFPIVLEKFPQIRAIYRALKSKINLRLSGTGSAMFALYDDRNEAELARQHVTEYCEAILVQPKKYPDLDT